MKWPDLRRLDGDLPPEIEKRYRRSYLKDDVKAVSISLAFLAVILVAFAYTDYTLFGLTSPFYFLVGLRSFYLAYFVALVIFLSKNRSPEKFDLSILISLIIGFAVLMAINLSRPSSDLGTFAVDIIILLILYLGIPTRMSIRFGGALFFTVAELLTFMFFREPTPVTYLYTLIIVLLMANAIGLFASGRLYSFRRSEFKSRIEEKRATEALQKSADLLTESGRIARVGGWEFDVGTDVQRWTDEVYRIHELPLDYQPTVAEEINYYAPEAVPIIRRAVERIIESGEPFDLELPFITAKGKHLWVHSIGRGYFEDGKVTRIGGTFQDITERSKNEEERNRAAELIQDLYNNAPAGYHSLDKDGVIVQINDTELEWLGYTRDEIVEKKRFRDFLTGESLKIYERNFPILKAGKSVKGLEYDIVRKDGTIMSVLVSATAIRDESGNFEMSRSTVFDVTEIKRLQRQIAESEKKYRTILEEMNDAYYEIDLAGNYTMVNEATCRALLATREELIGANSQAHIPAEDVETLRSTLTELYRSGESAREILIKTVRKDGSTAYAELYVSPIKDERGKVTGFRSLARDVSERVEFHNKLAEAAMHDALTGLANRSLLYDRFKIAQGQAERNNRKMALLELDLDRFKTVNDTLGHAAGDELLKSTAMRLNAVVRKSDTVARVGGEEFVVLIPEIARTGDAVATAKKIVAAFDRPFYIDGQELRITTSIGISIYPENGVTVDNLLKAADQAMYYIKQRGGNSYKLFSGDAKTEDG
jgi:diguanylate cyclase (GGDEF)-like protein/PAS domain S-box-containing protein